MTRMPENLHRQIIFVQKLLAFYHNFLLRDKYWKSKKIFSIVMFCCCFIKSNETHLIQLKKKKISLAFLNLNSESIHKKHTTQNMPKLLALGWTAAECPPPPRASRFHNGNVWEKERKTQGDRWRTKMSKRVSQRKWYKDRVWGSACMCVLCKPQVVLVVLDRSITRGMAAPAKQVSPHLFLSLFFPDTHQ